MSGGVDSSVVAALLSPRVRARIAALGVERATFSEVSARRE